MNLSRFRLAQWCQPECRLLFRETVWLKRCYPCSNVWLCVTEWKGITHLNTGYMFMYFILWFKIPNNSCYVVFMQYECLSYCRLHWCNYFDTFCKTTGLNIGLYCKVCLCIWIREYQAKPLHINNPLNFSLWLDI